MDAIISDPSLAWLASLFSIPAAIVGAVWLTSFFAYREGDPVYVGDKEVKPDVNDPVYMKAVAKAELRTVLSGIGFYLVAFFLVIVLINSASSSHRKVRAADVEGQVASKFLYLSDEEAEALVRDGETVTTGVVSHDGSVHEVDVQFRTSPRTSDFNLADADDYETFGRFPVPVAQQLEWLVAGLAEENYGITVEVGQVEELRVPEALPEEPDQYGTTPVVLSIGGGEFLRLDATLIWDGTDFKLVGPVNGNTLTELPRVE